MGVRPFPDNMELLENVWLSYVIPFCRIILVTHAHPKRKASNIEQNRSYCIPNDLIKISNSKILWWICRFYSNKDSLDSCNNLHLSCFQVDSAFLFHIQYFHFLSYLKFWLSHHTFHKNILGSTVNCYFWGYASSN